MYHLPKLYTAGLFLIIALTANCFCETVPEDLLTDNDEQLYKLKRDDLVDSILNEIMPPESAEDKKHEEDKSSKSTQEKQNELKDDAKSVYLSSVYPSPSTFSTANIDTIKIHTSKIASSSLSMNRSSAALNHTNIEPTQSTHELHSTLHLNQSNSSLNSEIRPSVFAIATTSRLGGNSTLLLLHSQMLVSTIVASTASLAIPSLPAPHSISTISDTAQSVIQPTSTYFAAETLPKSSVIAETPKIVNAERSFSIIKHVATETSHSPNTSSRKMPTVPDEQGYGGNYFPFDKTLPENKIWRHNSFKYSFYKLFF